MVDLKRRTLRDIDWLLVLSPVALTLFGCVAISSTAGPDFVKKQVICLGLGLIIAAAATFSDYRKIIVNVAPFFYGVVMVLLVLVLFIGVEINGNKAWLRIPGIGSLQPSEFAKLATILMLARYMSQPRVGQLSLKDMAIMAAIVMPPVILIALEHDTGTMLTFGAILGSFYFLGGMRKLYLIGAVVALAISLVAVYPHLKPYQQERIKVIIEPEKADPRGYGYQTIQSMIAVGSGGLLGKGVGDGTQGKLGFLPYAYSDFVGAVIAEETGLAGVLLMIFLYLIFLWRLISIAKGARDRAGALMIMSFVALVTFHIACNLGMVVGIMPIMGIPLPLLSSGGTAVMAVFAGVGLALSVRMKRFVN
ncbi:MAG TPA: FtsW/RodA/SpoVE family cell cycle protein [Blastocatellia bacterium]|nr:FtsW/RodA/SpoVE family cell cycle protein [Blastocatellia bacterium]